MPSKIYLDKVGDLVDISRPGSSYCKIGVLMHQIEFKVIVPQDDNRLHDGLELRQRFNHFSKQGISFFEVLVALSLRFEGIVGTHKRDDSSLRFRVLLNNMDLTPYRDDIFYDKESLEFAVSTAANRVMYRQYERDGTKGGLFPIPGTRKNIKNLELWYQMMAYIEAYY